ncbi:hypothetical protein ACLK19_05155 [Escherichia coli]
MFWDPSRFAAKTVNWKSGMVYCNMVMLLV